MYVASPEIDLKQMPPTTLPLLAYRAATATLAPAGYLALRRRAASGKEDSSRLSERLGHAKLARPQGQLLWIHGASVGECMAALPLIDELLLVPGRSVLLTSGTVTSAQVMAGRLPAGAVHQFVPIDTPGAVARFLDHWRPDAGLFVESEIWPNLLASAHARGVRLVLVNGKMSARSFRGWRRAPRTARRLLSFYDLCMVQDEEIADRLRSLGAGAIQITGNLKADAPPMPVDATMLNTLTGAIGGRPVLLAASTHPGEDETILPAHDALRRRHPDLLTIIAPRHPERGTEIAMLCGGRVTQRRSESAAPEQNTAIYIADTIGELGLFYRLASFAFVGGSLVPHGGQNPLEAARLGRAVLAGPHTENFTAAYDAIFAAQGTGRVHSCAEITATAEQLLADPAGARALGDAAASGAETLGGALKKTRTAVEALLSHAPA